MSKKKKTYKKKYKGVRYVAKALVKYQKGKYKSYNSALPDARKFVSTLNSNNEKVNLKNLWKYSRSRKKTTSKSSKTSRPEIDRNLKEPSFYFDLVDYPIWLLRTTNEVWFTSDLIPSNLPDIQGGTNIDYSDYFAPYVNFINSMKGLSDPNENRYETEWLVTCTEPFYNKAKKRWESKIISIDSSEDEFNYGFDPKNPSLLATKTKFSEPTPPTAPKEPEPTIQEPKSEPKTEPTPQPPSNADRVKEIRGLISDLRQDVKDGFISKEDYSKLVKDLTAKLDKGGKV